MSKLLAFLLLVGSLFLVSEAELKAQTQLPNAPEGLGPPPEPVLMRPQRPALPEEFEQKSPVPNRPVRVFNSVEVRRKAQELAALAQTLPSQVDQLSKNVLPADLIRQLRQIEKLAKHLRKEITP